jgi:hypothetical protein
MVRKALRVLGFILRNTTDFKDYFSIIRLFNALVRPIVEYNSCLWNPHYDKYVKRIELIQKKLINALNYRYFRYRHYCSYSSNLIFYKLENLSIRRKYFDVLLIFKIFNNYIDSDECTGLFSFNCKSHLVRHRDLFYVPFSSSNYYCNSPVVRCIVTYNTLINDNNSMDIFGTSLCSFKRNLKRYLSVTINSL